MSGQVEFLYECIEHWYAEATEQCKLADRLRFALQLIADGEVGDYTESDPRKVLALREVARDVLRVVEGDG